MTTHALTLPAPLARLAVDADVVLVPWEFQPELDETHDVWRWYPSQRRDTWSVAWPADGCMGEHRKKYVCPYISGDTLRIKPEHTRDYTPLSDEEHFFGPVASVEPVERGAVEMALAAVFREMQGKVASLAACRPEAGLLLDKAYPDGIPGWFWRIRKEGE